MHYSLMCGIAYFIWVQRQEIESTGTFTSCPALTGGGLIHLWFNAIGHRMAMARYLRGLMPKKKPYLTVYLSSDEQTRVAGQAGRAGLSISKFVKSVVLGHEVRSIVDHQAVLALLHSKADLGRLGGVLKCHLSETGGTEDWHADLRRLLQQIEVSQRDLARDFKIIINMYSWGRK